MKIVLLILSVNSILERNLSLNPDFYKDYDQRLADKILSDTEKEETSSLMSKIKEGISKMNKQKFAMHEVLEKTLERKAQYVKYKYHSASYQIDNALKYLLDKI